MDTTPYVFSRYNIDAVSYPKSPGVLVNRVYYNRLKCKNARGDRAQLSMSRTGGTIPGTLPVKYTMYPSAGNTLDTMLLFLGNSNKKFAGVVPLPIDLGAAGYTGCALAINPLIGFVQQASPFSFPIPNDQGLAGLLLYFQGIAIDTSKGVIVPTEDAWQTRLIRTRRRRSLYQTVYRSRYTTQADGFMSTTFFYAPVIRLQ